MQSFDFRRFWAFTRFDLWSQSTETLRICLLFPSLIVLKNIVLLLLFKTVSPIDDNYVVTAMLLSTALLCFRAYQRENATATAMLFLTLPVSHAERFVSRYISCFLLGSLGPIAILYLVSNLFTSLHAVGNGSEAALTLPGRDIQSGLIQMVVFQSICFAGGIYFRRGVWMKTALFSGLYLTGMVVVVFTLVAVGLMDEGSLSIDATSFPDATASLFMPLQYIWYLVFPVLLTTAAYLKSTENEARG